MRTLLTTTALVALLSTGAIAQDTSAGTNDLLEQGYQMVDTDGLASKLLGFPVYSTASDDAEQLGEINDIVIGDDGQVGAVIIGVGGFLGIGEKNVAVNYDELEWTIAEDDTERLVLNVSREELETAAAVELVEDDPARTAARDDQMAVDEPMDGEASDMAAAPATDMNADHNKVDTMDTADNDAMEPADETMEPADDMQVAEQPADRQPVDETLETGAVQQPDTMADDGMGALDTNTLAEFDESGLTAEELIGVNAYGPDNQHIGTIGDFVLGDNSDIDAVIIDFGGFLGIGVKEVAIAYDDLNFYTDEAGNISLLLNITVEQMEQATAFNRDTYDQERDTQRLVVGSL